MKKTVAFLKLSIANPSTGKQMSMKITDPRKLSQFYGKKLLTDFPGELIDEAYHGYVFRVTGGSDTDGFAMKEGIMTHKRVKLLRSMKNGFKPKREGARKRSIVLGCFISREISTLNLVVVKQGPNEIPQLCGEPLPVRLGPKRYDNIVKYFNLNKGDDVRMYMIPRTFKKNGKVQRKCPKIQRLITPVTKRRSARRQAIKTERRERARARAAEYNAQSE
ncbi:hypothetical protein PCE1_001054 [Barthelona sp. PCE]